MPEIEVRPAIASDIPFLVAIDHHYTSDRVWQMAFDHDKESAEIMINFRQVRLPRAVRVEYPRQPQALVDNWTSHSGLLVALLDGEPIGYICLTLNPAPLTTWLSDLVVSRQLRRQGIGSALMLAALEWAGHIGSHNLVMEMQPKNFPAIQLALKLGFEFCGYNDRHYKNHGIGIFFGKTLH